MLTSGGWRRKNRTHAKRRVAGLAVGEIGDRGLKERRLVLRRSWTTHMGREEVYEK